LTAFGLGGNAWSYSPEELKLLDLEISKLVKRFVIHTSVHQPVDNKIQVLVLGHLVSSSLVMKHGQSRQRHGQVISHAVHICCSRENLLLILFIITVKQ
jgi:hypothetical protein